MLLGSLKFLKHFLWMWILTGIEGGFDLIVRWGGMYGKGTYFHDLAGYSYVFGHHKGGKVQLFCAKGTFWKKYATAPND